jgi:hypothetical protein
MAAEAIDRREREAIDALRDREPDPFAAAPEEVESFVLAVRERVAACGERLARLPENHQRYLLDAAARQVRFAHARLERDRHGAIEVLERLFRLGHLPRPDGRYAGELAGFSTGLLSDPFFEWLTRIYLPLVGKTFDAAAATGDNVFLDNTWSRVTGALGWPEYRVHAEDDPPGTVRVFPFRTYPAPSVEDAGLTVLRLDYAQAPNPLPVRRVVEELVELPGGYLLGKAHMKGLREFRRVAIFGLFRD